MTEATTTRAKRRLIRGRVTSDKSDKTITVTVDRLVKHPKYGKYVRRQSKYRAHDEENAARQGDLVELMETRPMSKTKCWRLVQVLERAVRV